MKTRFSEEQIIGILREAERPNASARSVARRHIITETTFCGGSMALGATQWPLRALGTREN